MFELRGRVAARNVQNTLHSSVSTVERCFDPKAVRVAVAFSGRFSLQFRPFSRVTTKTDTRNHFRILGLSDNKTYLN